MRKVFSIVAILIICAIPMIKAQEIEQGVIRVFSIPEKVRVKIPELKFKGTLVNDKEMLVENVAEGEYNLIFSYLGVKLKKDIFLVANDTITVLANFVRMDVIAETAADLRETIAGYKRIEFLKDSIFAADEAVRIKKFNEAHNSDNSIDTLNFENEFMDDEVFYIVEDMPLFNGGDPAIEFTRYISKNLKYPKEAATKGIQGRVIVQFVINSKGKLVDAKIVAGVSPSLDQEAIRVVESSPLWTPGGQRGKPVEVRFSWPINFVL